MRRAWILVGTAVLAAGILIVSLLPGAGAAGQRARPDLVVSGGSVHVSGGKLKGTFVVLNKGDARAPRSTALLVVRARGGDRIAEPFRVRRLGKSVTESFAVSAPIPGSLPAGSLPVRACADGRGKVREESEQNNCHRVGTLKVSGQGNGGGGGSGSSVPANPVPFQKGQPFTLTSPRSNYWVFVPGSYDGSHRTPIALLVWMHGCGGESAGDIYTVDPGGAQDWITIAPGGREGDCWNPGADQELVLAAIASVKTHFNVNPRRVILGGYSSGGDLAYRLAFYHAARFAGLLAENTSPFRDTGSSQADSLAAASWKFNVVHLAHTEDEVYPIQGVRSETNAMAAAGFPITRIERPGTHYDGNTDSDLQTLLLPHIDDGWLSPP
jgi:pimeloyl-ACP methyl ester carboxylesterase